VLGIGALALMLGISYLGEAGATAASPLFVVPVIAGLLGLARYRIGVLGSGTLLTAEGIAVIVASSLQLAPDQSAAIAALRSTGRMVGQIAAVSITTAIIARVHEHRGPW
jgi:hypothetical protein